MSTRPTRGAARKILESVERHYPKFNADKEMNVAALEGMAFATGAVAAWLLHHQGERTLDKAVTMIAAIIRAQAHEGDALIREKKSLLTPPQ